VRNVEVIAADVRRQLGKYKYRSGSRHWVTNGKYSWRPLKNVEMARTPRDRYFLVCAFFDIRDHE
jgi:hypothetical protein